MPVPSSLAAVRSSTPPSPLIWMDAPLWSTAPGLPAIPLFQAVMAMPRPPADRAGAGAVSWVAGSFSAPDGAGAHLGHRSMPRRSTGRRFGPNDSSGPLRLRHRISRGRSRPCGRTGRGRAPWRGRLRSAIPAKRPADRRVGEHRRDLDVGVGRRGRGTGRRSASTLGVWLRYAPASTRTRGPAMCPSSVIPSSRSMRLG